MLRHSFHLSSRFVSRARPPNQAAGAAVRPLAPVKKPEVAAAAAQQRKEETTKPTTSPQQRREQSHRTLSSSSTPPPETRGRDPRHQQRPTSGVSAFSIERPSSPRQKEHRHQTQHQPRDWKGFDTRGGGERARTEPQQKRHGSLEQKKRHPRRQNHHRDHVKHHEHEALTPDFICRRVSNFKWHTRRTIPLDARRRIFDECNDMFDRLFESLPTAVAPAETAAAAAADMPAPVPAWLHADDALGAILNAAASFDLTLHPLVKVVVDTATKRMNVMQVGRALQCANALLRMKQHKAAPAEQQQQQEKEEVEVEQDDDATATVAEVETPTPLPPSSTLFDQVLVRCSEEFASLTLQQLGVAASVLQMLGKSEGGDNTEVSDSQQKFLSQLCDWVPTAVSKRPFATVQEAAAAVAAAVDDTNWFTAKRKEVNTHGTVFSCLVDLAPDHAATHALCVDVMLPSLPFAAPQQIVFFASTGAKLCQHLQHHQSSGGSAALAKQLLTELLAACAMDDGHRRFRVAVSSQSCCFLARAVADLLDLLRLVPGDGGPVVHHDPDLSDLAWQSAELIDFCCSRLAQRLMVKDSAITAADLAQCLGAARRAGVNMEADTLTWGRRMLRQKPDLLATSISARLQALTHWSQLVLLTVQAAASSSSSSHSSSGSAAEAAPLRLWSGTVAPRVVSSLSRELRVIQRVLQLSQKDREHLLARDTALLESLAEAVAPLGMPLANTDEAVSREKILGGKKRQQRGNNVLFLDQLELVGRSAVLLARSVFTSPAASTRRDNTQEQKKLIESSVSVLVLGGTLTQLLSTVEHGIARLKLEEYCRRSSSQTSSSSSSSAVSNVDLDMRVLAILPLLSTAAQRCLLQRIKTSLTVHGNDSENFCPVAIADRFQKSAECLLLRDREQQQRECVEQIAKLIQSHPRYTSFFRSADSLGEPLPPFLIDQQLRAATSLVTVLSFPQEIALFDAAGTVRQAVAFGRLSLVTLAVHASLVLLSSDSERQQHHKQQQLAEVRSVLGVSKFAELGGIPEEDNDEKDGGDGGVKVDAWEEAAKSTDTTEAAQQQKQKHQQQQEEKERKKKRKQQLLLPRWMTVVLRNKAVQTTPLSVAVLVCALLQLQQGQPARLVWNEVVEALKAEMVMMALEVKKTKEEQEEPAVAAATKSEPKSKRTGTSAAATELEENIFEKRAPVIPASDIVCALRLAAARVGGGRTSSSNSREVLLFPTSTPIDRSFVLRYLGPILENDALSVFPSTGGLAAAASANSQTMERLDAILTGRKNLWLVGWTDIDFLARLCSGVPSFFCSTIASRVEYDSISGRVTSKTLLALLSSCFVVIGSRGGAPAAAAATATTGSSGSGKGTGRSGSGEVEFLVQQADGESVVVAPPTTKLPPQANFAIETLRRERLMRLTDHDMLLLVAGLSRFRAPCNVRMVTVCSTMLLLRCGGSTTGETAADDPGEVAADSIINSITSTKFWHVISILARTEWEWLCQSAAGVIAMKLKEQQQQHIPSLLLSSPAAVSEMFVAVDLLTEFPTVCGDQGLWSNWAEFIKKNQQSSSSSSPGSSFLAARNVRSLLSVATRVAMPEVLDLAAATLGEFSRAARCCSSSSSSVSLVEDATIVCEALDPLLPMPAQLRAALTNACLSGFLGLDLSGSDETMEKRQRSEKYVVPRIVQQLPAATLVFLIHADGAFRHRPPISNQNNTNDKDDDCSSAADEARDELVLFESILARLDLLLPAIRGRTLATCCSALGSFARTRSGTDAAAFAKSMLSRCTLLVADRESGCGDEDLFFVCDALEASGVVIEDNFRALTKRRIETVMRGVVYCEELHEKKLMSSEGEEQKDAGEGKDEKKQQQSRRAESDDAADESVLTFAMLPVYEKALRRLLISCEMLQRSIMAEVLAEDPDLKPKLEEWCKEKGTDIQTSMFK